MNEKVFIGLGSNIEPRLTYLNKAIERIEKNHEIVSIADFVETEPWGFEAATLFLNTVIEIKTNANPRELLLELQSIENELGRTSKSANQSYTSRTIDLDILYFNREILVSPDLTIPHPEIHKRLFVLEPLRQIAPNFQDPKSLRLVREMYQTLIEISEEK